MLERQKGECEMNNAIFDPEEYVRNGGRIETVEFRKVECKKRKRKKQNLKKQKLYGLMNLIGSCVMMLMGIYIPELWIWALILFGIGIAALVSKEKIIF